MTMAVDTGNLTTFGYSGGAVPELHRDSLFVGQFKLNHPTTSTLTQSRLYPGKWGMSSS